MSKMNTTIERLRAEKVEINAKRAATQGLYYLLDNDEIVYVNYSLYGKRRVFDHLKGPKNVSKQFTHYVWIAQPGEIESELKRFTLDEIKKYKPKYNKPEIVRGVVSDVINGELYYNLAAYSRLVDVKYHCIRDVIRDLRHSESGVDLVKTSLRTLHPGSKYYLLEDLNNIVKPMIGLKGKKAALGIGISDNPSTRYKERKRLLSLPNPIRIINHNHA